MVMMDSGFFPLGEELGVESSLGNCGLVGVEYPRDRELDGKDVGKLGEMVDVGVNKTVSMLDLMGETGVIGPIDRLLPDEVLGLSRLAVMVPSELISRKRPKSVARMRLKEPSLVPQSRKATSAAVRSRMVTMFEGNFDLNKFVISPNFATGSSVFHIIYR